VIVITKIINDKYYTSKDLTEYIVNKTKEIIGDENISEYIEPSAGGGIFLDYLDKPYLAYDIEPEDNRVLKEDFLKLNLEYKKNRCIIGNPPYGNKNILVTKFINKSKKIADYISFILPIGNLNNSRKFKDLDLIYSEDLGERLYSGKKVRCCFNIYKKNINKIQDSIKLNDVKIITVQRYLNKEENFTYDLRISAWGNGSMGKICEYPNQYAKEHCIIINNKNYKDKIINLILEAKWREIYPMTSMASLTQWHIYKYIKEQIPEIE
jgi:hypothetical protein